jgi:four helix bundle protein
MSGLAKSFRDLDVYKSGLDLMVDVHKLCKTLPREERYVLADQMARASRSVCSNIAEAWRKRKYKAAFASKLSDAEAEAGEMQSWLDVALALHYLDRKMFDQLDARYEQVISQLVNMQRNVDKWCVF